MSGSARIKIARDGDGYSVQPAAYLGDEFSHYLAAMRATPARFDRERKLYSVPAGALGDVAAALRGAGFSLVSENGTLEELRRLADDMDEGAQRLRERAAQLASDVARNGRTLMPHQVEALAYLLGRDGRGACLWCDMGVGKTSMALAALEGEPMLVVCPAAAKGVWRTEAAIVAPDYRVSVLSGRGSFRWPARGEIVVTNYELLDDEVETPWPGTTLVVDEAHACKDSRSQRSRRVDALVKELEGTGGRWIMATGTPLENQPMELRNVLQAARCFSETFGSWGAFLDAFGARKVPIRVRGGATRQVLQWGSPKPHVPALLARACLRQRKADVLQNLPPKRWQRVDVEMSSADHRAVNAATDKLVSMGIDLAEIRDRATVKRMVAVAFEEISAAMRVLAIAKVPHAIAIAQEYEEAGEPLVVFSAHVAPARALGERKGWGCITGETRAEDRDEIVRRFQAGELCGLAGTIQAMGVAVTLHRAHDALVIDPTWTPAKNRQAEDRLHRHGQHHPVLVRYLVADHVLDDRIHEVCVEKEALEMATVDAMADAPSAASALRSVVTDEANDSTEARRRVERVTTLPSAGRYALPTGDGGASNELAFWVVSRPTEGRWAGWTFLSQQIGPNEQRAGAVRPDGTPTAATSVSVLERIAEDEREAMQRYGREIGVCGVCGLALTNEDSRRVGIGPVCLAKLGLRETS